MDEVTGLPKIDVARYYDAIAEWALPWLHDRPLTLVRAPEGIEGELFFQKHADRMRIQGVTELPKELHPRHPPLLVANTAEALVGLAQMSVVVMSARGCPYARSGGSPKRTSSGFKAGNIRTRLFI